MRRGKTGNGVRFWKLAAVAVLTVALFSGCASEKKEQELAYRELGIDHMQEGNYAEAVIVFDKALAECSGRIGATEIDISYYKAAAQYASGDVEGALETYSNLIDYNSKDADAYYMRGCLRLQMGDTSGAGEDFDAAVKQDARDYELYIGIYENYAAYGMDNEGVEYLNQACSITGDTAEDYAWRGRSYFLLGQYDKATQELKTALEKGSIAAYLTLGEIYESMGDTVTAESYYRTYVESGEADSETMNRLAVLAMARQDYEGALAFLGQGLEMEQVPNQQEMMRNQIACLEYTGDFSGAWTVVQEYVAMYPEDLEAQREYVFLKHRQGE